MAMRTIRRALKRDLDLDLDFEASAEDVDRVRPPGGARAGGVRGAVGARPYDAGEPSRGGFRPLDPAGRPS